MSAYKHKRKKYSRECKLLTSIPNKAKDNEITSYYQRAKNVHLGNLLKWVRKNTPINNNSKRPLVQEKNFKRKGELPPIFSFYPTEEELEKMILKASDTKH